MPRILGCADTRLELSRLLPGKLSRLPGKLASGKLASGKLASGKLASGKLASGKLAGRAANPGVLPRELTGKLSGKLPRLRRAGLGVRTSDRRASAVATGTPVSAAASPASEDPRAVSAVSAVSAAPEAWEGTRTAEAWAVPTRKPEVLR